MLGPIATNYRYIINCFLAPVQRSLAWRAMRHVRYAIRPEQSGAAQRQEVNRPDRENFLIISQPELGPVAASL